MEELILNLSTILQINIYSYNIKEVDQINDCIKENVEYTFSFENFSFLNFYEFVYNCESKYSKAFVLIIQEILKKYSIYRYSDIYILFGWRCPLKLQNKYISTSKILVVYFNVNYPGYLNILLTHIGFPIIDTKSPLSW